MQPFPLGVYGKGTKTGPWFCSEAFFLGEASPVERGDGRSSLSVGPGHSGFGAAQLGAAGGAVGAGKLWAFEWIWGVLGS